jgi:hypothetical protein
VAEREGRGRRLDERVFDHPEAGISVFASILLLSLPIPKDFENSNADRVATPASHPSAHVRLPETYAHVKPHETKPTNQSPAFHT